VAVPLARTAFPLTDVRLAERRQGRKIARSVPVLLAAELWVSAPAVAQAQAVCGNRVIDLGEACDDGNPADGTAYVSNP
jgi:hypothetical protein